MRLVRIACATLPAILLGFAAVADTPAFRTFTFEYEARITDVAEDAGRVDVWIPIPPSTPWQTVKKIEIDTTGGVNWVEDPDHGNRFAHIRLNGSAPEPTVSARYTLTRHTRHGLATPSSTPVEPANPRYLGPSRLIRIEEPIVREAQRVAGDIEEPLEIARRLYDHIVGTVRYDKSGEGWGRGDSLYACDVRAGNCTDFHSLFIAEARALGVPARFVMGFPLPAELGNGEIPGYHCWAEFWTRDQGWIPVDASEAFNQPQKRDFFFGNLDAHRIQFTVGRDLAVPGIKGPPLNYAIYPYAEVDGKPHAGMQTTYRFQEIANTTD